MSSGTQAFEKSVGGQWHWLNASANVQVQEFRAGEKIVQRGSAGSSIFFIDVGCVRAEVRGHALPDVLTSGNHFGEISFVASCKGLVPVHALICITSIYTSTYACS